MFVIPIECLSRTGIESRFRDDLVARGLASENWIDLLERAYAAYWTRCDDLARRAPNYWFPPRVQSLCVVTEPGYVRPYFQPFHRASSLVYEADFDPAQSNVEFGVLQLLQVERAGLMQQLAPVLGCNLSYLLTLDDAQHELLRTGCESTTRPDASFHHALARALPWLRQLYHEVLRPPSIDPGPAATLQGTGLIVPRARQSEMQALLSSWARTAEHVAEQHYRAHSGRTRNHAQDVGEWIARTKPRVIVTGLGGRTLWDPDQSTRTGDLVKELRGLTGIAAESLCADLATIGRHSQNFLAAVREPDALPAPNPASADQNGLSYMHLERREIAYNVREPSMQRLREPAPAFERLMLGARTIHEWGHLATEAGWVPADPEPLARCQSELATLLDEIVDAVPPRLAATCAPSLRRLQGNEASPGRALAHLAVSRIEDYQANLVAQPFLSPEERDTYVRNNLRSLVHEYPPEAFFQRLVRYAYDYQYLRFTSIEDPRSAFLKSTWFAEQYLTPGLLSEEHFQGLFDLMGRLCGLYAVDESRFQGLA